MKCILLMKEVSNNGLLKKSEILRKQLRRRSMVSLCSECFVWRAPESLATRNDRMLDGKSSSLRDRKDK